MPTDSRTSAGVMPIARCSSAGTSAWVMVAGCSISDSVPPRLTASLISRTALRKRNASASPAAASSKEIRAPGPLHWRS